MQCASLKAECTKRPVCVSRLCLRVSLASGCVYVCLCVSLGSACALDQCPVCVFLCLSLTLMPSTYIHLYTHTRHIRSAQRVGRRCAAAHPGERGTFIAQNFVGPEVRAGARARGTSDTRMHMAQVAKLLYQDANLRVFESPKESESEWEKEGLVVVQMPIASVP